MARFRVPFCSVESLNCPTLADTGQKIQAQPTSIACRVLYLPYVYYCLILAKACYRYTWGFLLGMNPFVLGCIAVAACLGHMYPIYFGFVGGKGVATALGCMIPLDWGILAGITTTWLLVYKAFRYSSLAALITVCIAPALTYWLKSDYVYAVSMLSALIIWQHRGNISRLVQGNEPKT